MCRFFWRNLVFSWSKRYDTPTMKKPALRLASYFLGAAAVLAILTACGPIQIHTGAPVPAPTVTVFETIVVTEPTIEAPEADADEPQTEPTVAESPAPANPATEQSTAPAVNTPAPAQTATQTPAAPAPAQPVAGPISREQAEQIAVNFLGQGRVTWVEQEDDFGAAWEIEVTLPGGREVDVYVASDGRVVNTSPRSFMRS